MTKVKVQTYIYDPPALEDRSARQMFYRVYQKHDHSVCGFFLGMDWLYGSRKWKKGTKFYIDEFRVR